MAEVKLMDVVQVLAEDIGPRPTGTEEEQRAATAIQQWLQKDAGLSAAIEEVDGDPELETANTICFGVAFLATFLAFIVKALALPAILLTLAAAVVVVLEELGIPIITRFLRKGISQNVVAVYEPERIVGEDEAPQRGRARKVVLIARYDSARVRAETNGGLARIAGLSNLIETFALIATPVVMLVHYLFFMYDQSAVGTVFRILTVVLLALMGLHLVKALGRRLAKYNDAANCNATGVAVLVDLAQRINGSALAFTPRASRGAKGEAVRHGADAAREAGVVPEGAELEYDAEETGDDGFASDGMDEGPGGRSGLTWGAAAGAAAVAGAVAAAAGTREGTPAPEDDADVATTTPSWRGRATASRGYATVDSNLEITSRPLGAAPGSGFEGAYAPSTPSADAQPAAPASGPRTVRAELNDIDYMGDNPRLEAARAAVRAQRAANEAAGNTGSFKRETVSARLSSPTAERTTGTAAPAVRNYGVGSTAGSTLTPASASSTYETIDFVAAAAAAEAAARGEIAASSAETSAPAPAPEPEPERKPAAIPDWFTRGKAASHKPAEESANVMRSRFNDALRRADALTATAAEPEPEPANVPDASADFMPPAPRTPEPITLPAGGVIAPVVNSRPRVTAYAIPEDNAYAVAPAPIAPAAAVAEEAVASAPDVTAPQAAVREITTASLEPVAAPAAVTAAIAASEPEPEAAPALAPAPAVPAPQPTTGFAAALAAAQQAEERQIAEGKLSPSVSNRLSVMLPEIGASASMKPITTEDLQQRAPLAQAQTSGKEAAKSLLTLLPSISLDGSADAVAATAEAAVAAETPVQAQVPAAAAVAGGAGRTIGGMTAAFASVGDELAQKAGEDDLFVDDADDSAFRQNFTSTGAFAGPGYVDMPKGRKGLLGRLFGGKKKETEISTREWLHIEDDFDARTVGAARGGWESFREDSDYNRAADYGDFTPEQDGFEEEQLSFNYGYNGYNGYTDPENDDFNADDVADDGYPTRNWNGGAFSLKGLIGKDKGEAAEAKAPAGRHGRRTQGAFDDLAGNYDDPFAEDAEFDGYGDRFADGFDGYDDGYGAPADGYDYAEPYADASAPAPEADEGDYGAYRRTLGAGDLFAEDDAPRRPSTMADFALAPVPDDGKDLQEIFDFRDGNIQAEVWFVALGSESPNNSGMKAFLDAHGSELKNAVFIELEGMGAGDLSLTTSEGRFRRLPVAGRMRRYVQKAQQALNIKVGSCTYNIDNSATYTAMMRGMQAMHLVGVDGAKPAYQHQADDVVEVVDPELLQRNADFVMELIRSI